MAQVKVNYLKSNRFYSDGQSIVDNKEEAMMPDGQIEYYLNGAKERGLDFSVETEIIEVSQEEAEDYAYCGYEVL